MPNSKRKGGRGEREAVKFLCGLGYDCRRTVQYAGKASDSSDIAFNDPHVQANLRAEIKLGYNAVKVTSDLLVEWMTKVTKECHGTQKPVLLWRKDRGKWLAAFWIDLRGERMIAISPDVKKAIEHVLSV